MDDNFAIAVEMCYWRDWSEKCCNNYECPYYSSWEACRAVKFLVKNAISESEEE